MGRRAHAIVGLDMLDMLDKWMNVTNSVAVRLRLCLELLFYDISDELHVPIDTGKH
jgi:hypothetical protein